MEENKTQKSSTRRRRKSKKPKDINQIAAEILARDCGTKRKKYKYFDPVDYTMDYKPFEFDYDLDPVDLG